MADGPDKKRRKLTSALKDAIGAHSQKPEENIEKPIALALISDNKAAQDLLNKIQASRRPQAILEATLKICKEKKSEAHVDEAFLSIFRKHFSILGVDSALACWKLIEEHLNSSESINEIRIANEFISTSNLLGHGFGKLLQNMKQGIPVVIQNTWRQERKADALALAYPFLSLLLADQVYGDHQNLESLAEFWKNQVLPEKSMKKDFGMRMVSALAGGEPGQLPETKIDENQLEMLSKIYENHLEFYTGILSESTCSQLLAKVIEDNLAKNELKQLARRCQTAEVCMSPLKEITKHLPSIINSCSNTRQITASKKLKNLENLQDFLHNVTEKPENDNFSAAFALLSINISLIFDNWNFCEKILKTLPKDVLEKLIKAGKGSENENILKVFKKVAQEAAPVKFVNRTAADVAEKLREPEFAVAEALSLLQGVHTAETKKEVFDSVVKFVEEIPGAESIDEMKLFKLIIEMYGGSQLESLAVQVVFSRIAADGWTEMDRAPGTEKSDESWFTVLVETIDLLDIAMKSAKNSVLKSFTALFCQLFSQVLKNSQKFVRNSLNAVASRTLSPEMETEFVLRRHKLSQDLARLVDAMKRNESYFAMVRF
nr:hypothetical protein R02F2.7 - Caenorhabditis elegans [Caenorhabditis elegans]